MACFDPLDLSHYLIRDGVDDMDVIPGGVCLDDPQLRAWRGQQGKGHRAQNDPAKTARHPRTTFLFVIFVISSFERQAILNGRFPAGQSVTPTISTSLQTPMLSMLTTPGCPAS